MKNVFDNYECDGQISIFDYIADRDSKIYEVDYIGLMDDPICPNCRHEFEIYNIERYHIKSEIDIERCPKCKVRLNWDRWHKVNDEEGESDGKLY